jgi:Zn-dependent protease
MKTDSERSQTASEAKKEAALRMLRRCKRVCLACGEVSPLASDHCLECKHPLEVKAFELLVLPSPWGMRILGLVVVAAFISGVIWGFVAGLIVAVFGALSLGPMFRWENQRMIRQAAKQIAAVRGPREAHAFITRYLAKPGHNNERLAAEAEEYAHDAGKLEDRLQQTMKRVLAEVRAGHAPSSDASNDFPPLDEQELAALEAAAEEDEPLCAVALPAAETPKPIAPVTAELTLWACVLGLVAVVPGVGLFAGIAALIVLLYERRSKEEARFRDATLSWDRPLRRIAWAAALSGLVFHAFYFAGCFFGGMPEAPAFFSHERVKMPVWAFSVVAILVLWIAFTLHECFHAAAGFLAGDPTAKDQKRVSLNPFNQLDLIGSVVLPLAIAVGGSPAAFGYAKPTPYDERRVRRSAGLIGITLAGPLANLVLMGAAFSALMLLKPLLVWLGFDGEIFYPLDPREAYFAPTVDGSAAHPLALLLFFLHVFIFLNLLLLIFNLLPIPPLDGFSAVAGFFPPAAAKKLRSLQAWGWLPLLLIFSSKTLVPYLLLPFYLLWFCLGGLLRHVGGY